MNGPTQRKQVSEFSLKLHEMGWVANHDGNVSLRSKNGFWISPTGISKRVCTPATIVACDSSGKPTGSGRPPSEVAIHVAAYESREDVQAVIHAHPPHVSAFSMCARPLAPISMPEVVVSIGPQIPLLPLYIPKDSSVKAAVHQGLAMADAIMPTGNGAVTVGPDLETAYLRMELLEHYAKILSIALSGLGAPPEIPAEQMQKLIELRKKAGLHRGPEQVSSNPSANSLQKVVAEEVRRALGVR